jgi:hypothetical protein
MSRSRRPTHLRPVRPRWAWNEPRQTGDERGRFDLDRQRARQAPYEPSDALKAMLKNLAPPPATGK